MISSIQGNAGWLPANHTPQVASRETAGEVENDGDSDDAARSVEAAASRNLPQFNLPLFVGGRIDTLA